MPDEDQVADGKQNAQYEESYSSQAWNTNATYKGHLLVGITIDFPPPAFPPKANERQCGGRSSGSFLFLIPSHLRFAQAVV